MSLSTNREYLPTIYHGLKHIVLQLRKTSKRRTCCASYSITQFVVTCACISRWKRWCTMVNVFTHINALLYWSYDSCVHLINRWYLVNEYMNYLRARSRVQNQLGMCVCKCACRFGGWASGLNGCQPVFGEWCACNALCVVYGNILYRAENGWCLILGALDLE